MDMIKRTLAVTLSLFCLAFLANTKAQTTMPTPSDDDVVKITTKLVQTDVVVVDKDGKQVTNLTPSDFQILQDGKPQKVSAVTYVSLDSAAESKPADMSPDKGVAVPPIRMKPTDGGRLITFIVDDGNCQASALGMMAAREGLEKFIREQMLASDRVAVYLTRAGSSVLQQYTNDKTVLLKAAKKIRWFPGMSGCGTSDGSFTEAARPNTITRMTANGIKTSVIESAAEKKIREAGEDLNRNSQIVGSLGVIRYVVNGLARLPGRKLLFVLSDGIPLRSLDGSLLRSTDVLRDLTDLANRSAVVVNTIDVRGVTNPTMVEARDDAESDGNGTSKLMADRMKENSNREGGMAFLADETGGHFYRGQNFLEAPIRQALDLQKGYYLVAYEPDDSTFKNKNFNKIEVRVNQPGFRVISRAGFIGVTDTDTKPVRRSEDSDLYQAIAAPLPAAGVDLQLNAYFGNSQANGNFVRSLIHIEGNDIKFVDDSNGLKRASIDIVAVTLDEKNKVIDEFTRKHTFKIDAAAIPLIRQNGLVYSTDVPIKKPGTYTFRVALRDNESRQLGSASQIVEIPDLKKDKLFLSGLTVTQVDQNGKFTVPAAVNPENAISLTASGGVPAVRRFERGSIIAYPYTIYNARLDRSTKLPKLTIQMNLYRDGKVFSKGTPQNADLEKQADWSRINDYGYLRLNSEVEPGDYTLQLIVTDLLADGKSSTASDSIDFEVVR